MVTRFDVAYGSALLKSGVTSFALRLLSSTSTRSRRSREILVSSSGPLQPDDKIKINAVKQTAKLENLMYIPNKKMNKTEMRINC